ncbi:MAG: TRAP transporter small permease subunit [Gammaproteobacteria bacterium]|nr:MAG: TRAP transporter small permease subunit [Gammaproteobacteria bacterium]
MIRLVYFINTVSAWVGKGFAWSILVLTLGVTYEVFVRKALRDPTVWAFDISYLMYGALFMMAGAYTLSRNGHVRADVIYRLWPQRVQAILELILYFLFFFPGMAALIYAGIDYAGESWSYRPYGPAGHVGEISINSPAGVPVSPLKTILPVAAAFLALQGIAEVIRCVLCIKTGEWPRRLQDVEELETALIAEREQELEHEMHLDESTGPGEGAK